MLYSPPTILSGMSVFQVLNAAGCMLVGGHTCEGEEASLGKSRS